MLDLNAVATAVTAAVTAQAITLDGKLVTAADFVPQAIDPPFFAVGEFENLVHRTYSGMNELTLKCAMYVSLATEDEGQRKCRAVASSSGANSVQGAVEAARGAPGQSALSGAANDIVLRNTSGPKVFEIAGKAYYGVEFELYVVG
jgi:hypothetical protein